MTTPKQTTLRVVSDDDPLFDGVEEAQPELRLLSELEAARFFVREYGERLRYCARAGGWFVWDGVRWVEDVDGAVFRLAEECVDRIADLGVQTRDLEQRKRITAFALLLSKRRGLENLVAIAQNDAMVALGDPGAFDAHPMSLNVANGVLDLEKGTLAPHRPESLAAKIVPVAYDADALCERWERFLREVFGGDEDLIAFLQRAVGYSLTASTREQCFFVAHGTGANGKSTLLRLLGRIVGEYHTAARADTFLSRKPGGATNDLARLHRARCVVAIETGEDRRLDEAFVKAVTGGDVVVARFLFKEEFAFEPAFKLWLACNHRPVIKGTDRGIWRRVRLIPFSQTFEGDRCDPELNAKLEAELPGILAWAVRGCAAWQRDGLGDCKAVRMATATYRSDMDAFGDFIAERCIVMQAALAGTSALYHAYREWAEEAGERPQSQRWLSLRLRDEGFEHKRTRDGAQWLGIGLKA